MYNEELKKLFDKLNDSQKAVVEEMDQEGITIQDEEFTQMARNIVSLNVAANDLPIYNELNSDFDVDYSYITHVPATDIDIERNKKKIEEENKQKIKKNEDAIIEYYIGKAALKTKFHFDKLSDIEKSFIEDATAEGLYPGDPEFDQMLNERIVNRDKIYKYYDYKKDEFLLNYSRSELNFIDQMIKDGIKVGDPEFDERINKSTYDKDKIIKYYNNINWINNTDKYFVTKANEEKRKKEEEKKKEEDLKNNEQSEENNKVNNKPIPTKTFDPYEGKSYYERLELYAKEKEKNPSRLDSYDDELQQMKKMENAKKMEIIKVKKNWLIELKNKLQKNKQKDVLSDENDVSKKLGFIDILAISIVTIIICIILILILTLFKK